VILVWSVLLLPLLLMVLWLRWKALAERMG
jgi:hypothetical protein